MTTLIIVFLVLPCIAWCSTPEDPISCTNQPKRCTITNAYGVFPDRAVCSGSAAMYPSTEEELVAAVAGGVKRKQKMKVATRHSHSIPKLVCPDGNDGLLISTRHLNRVLTINKANKTITVEAGMTLKDLIKEAATAGLVLPYTPYWWGLSIGGLLSTGAHGSSLWGKGSAVHEYVVGLRIVTPASSEEGFAMVRDLDETNPHLDAAKVSIGVLGVVSQVTLKLEPIFKRSISYVERNDSDLVDQAAKFGLEHEFADITWYPSQRKAVYRIDDRAPSNTPGNGHNDFIGFRPTLKLVLQLNRKTEEGLETAHNYVGKCLNAKLITSTLTSKAYGLKNDGGLFTGYPVVGYQNRLQSSGSCLEGAGAATLLGSCPWDSRANGEFFHQTAISIALPNVNSFISDVQSLRDLNSAAFCGLELYNGVVMRYVRGSSAFLGKQEDVVDFDFTYYRSHDPSMPRLHEDVMEEVEQMAVFKYKGQPHWGKNRNLVFDDVAEKYERMKDFVEVKTEFDPDRLFSSEWTDQMLGVGGRASIVKKGCALEGLCVCSEDSHCAPEQGYLCMPGKVYKDARVCTKV